jgi:HEPN domain-containing protein
VKQESSAFMLKAERALRAAEILLRAGDAESAAGRAYYAMLHAAQALLRARLHLSTTADRTEYLRARRVRAGSPDGKKMR